MSRGGGCNGLPPSPDGDPSGCDSLRTVLIERGNASGEITRPAGRQLSIPLLADGRSSIIHG